MSYPGGRVCKVENGDIYMCARDEYCCNIGCCMSPSFQFYQLWYYWFMVFFMFLVCSIGQWWFRGVMNGRCLSAMPPPQRHRLTTYPRQCHVAYTPARDTVVLHHLWKPETIGSPPSYSQSEASCSASPKPSPYMQLYGPPPSYESVIASSPISPVAAVHGGSRSGNGRPSSGTGGSSSGMEERRHHHQRSASSGAPYTGRVCNLPPSYTSGPRVDPVSSGPIPTSLPIYIPPTSLPTPDSIFFYRPILADPPHSHHSRRGESEERRRRDTGGGSGEVCEEEEGETGRRDSRHHHGSRRSSLNYPLMTSQQKVEDRRGSHGSVIERERERESGGVRRDVTPQTSRENPGEGASSNPQLASPDPLVSPPSLR